VLFFIALFETLRRLVRRPTLALTATATVGLVVWAMVLDRAVPCADDGDCLDAWATVGAVIVAGIWWLAYLAGSMLGRFVERLRTPRT